VLKIIKGYMVLYRVIQHNGDTHTGIVKHSVYSNLMEAYRQCIPSDETEACRLLFNGVQDEIQKGKELIRVTCDKENTWWIQLVVNSNDPLGPVTPKIECCHAH
jgi:hypothetical protein